MDLTLSEAQVSIQRVARDFLERELPPRARRALDSNLNVFDPLLYSQMAGLGWLGFALPAAYGGNDAALEDLALLYEELGRALTPGPHLTSSVLAGQAILAGGTDAQKRELLPNIVQGELIVSVAQLEGEQDRREAGVHATARRDGNSWVLDGTKLFVPSASVADVFIVAARTDDGVGLFLVDKAAVGLTVRTMHTFPNDLPGELTLSEVRVAEDRRLPGGWAALAHANRVATVMLCAEMVGGMQYVLDLSVDYAKKRVQFGRPIGAFQAIQHKAVAMVTELTGARLITYQTAWRLQRGLASETDISLAKAKSNKAYRLVTFEGHEIHGAIGWSVEYDLQLYFRRRTVDEVAFGDYDDHMRTIADALVAGDLPQSHYR